MQHRKLTALAGGLVILLAACLGNDAASNDPTVPTTKSPPVATSDVPTSTAPNPSGDSPIVDWEDASKVTDLGDGWTITACEGDGPFLCVEKDGAAVGVVEAASFPVTSFDDLDSAADVETNLATFVHGFHEAIGTDRAAGCGADYLFDGRGPDPFVLGNAPGVSYGFGGTLADGTASELNLQYATIVEDQIITVSAIAYDEGGCPGRDDLSTWDSATLSEFQTRLENALHESPLPSL